MVSEANVVNIAPIKRGGVGQLSEMNGKQKKSVFIKQGFHTVMQKKQQQQTKQKIKTDS